MKFLPLPAIEHQAIDLLRASHTDTIPVRVDMVAYHLGIKVEFAQLGENVSGLLIIEQGKPIIGINELHPDVRQRFTLAHEIGHYILHRHDATLFIDKRYSIVFRDPNASSGEHRAEIQANQFAAALLMPYPLLEAEVARRHLDLGDDRVLMMLAREFQVSVQAMGYRLSNLELFEA